MVDRRHPHPGEGGGLGALQDVEQARHVRQGELVELAPDNEGWCLDPADPVLHPVGVHRDVSFLDPVADAHGVDHQPSPQVRAVPRVERRAPVPQLLVVAAVVGDRNPVDRRPLRHRRPASGDDVRHPRQDQAAHRGGAASRHLHRDHTSGVVADEGNPIQAEHVDQVLDRIGQQLDRPRLGGAVGGPEPERVGR